MSRWNDDTVLPAFTREEIIQAALEWPQTIHLTEVPWVLDNFLRYNVEGTYRQQSDLALLLLKQYWRNNEITQP